MNHNKSDHAVKKIAWVSWNSMADSIITLAPDDTSEIEKAFADDEVGGEMFLIEGAGHPQVIHTPLGVYPIDSSFKPSDRWDCWIGHTNFGITLDTQNVLKHEVEGIEALRTLGKYTFFIGVASCFNFRDVRDSIVNKLCVYTEEEIISSKDLKNTLELMKKQFKDMNFWSIFVDTRGNIEYRVSDKNDFKYIRDVGKLIEKKKNNGGILFRSEEGESSN
jgi:hypothetical protein